MYGIKYAVEQIAAKNEMPYRMMDSIEKDSNDPAQTRTASVLSREMTNWVSSRQSILKELADRNRLVTQAFESIKKGADAKQSTYFLDGFNRLHEATAENAAAQEKIISILHIVGVESETRRAFFAVLHEMVLEITAI